MLNQLNRFIVNCSRSWWKILLLLAGQMGTMQFMNNITRQFPAVSAGNIPFDMQHELTAAQIFTQLEGYSDEAFSLYYRFQALDFLFPLFAGLFLATVFAFALRHAAPGWYAVANARNLFVLMLVVTLFDYLENIHLLWVVSVWPETPDLVAQLAVAAKRAKLAGMGIAFSLTTVALLGALVQYARRRLSRTS